MAESHVAPDQHTKRAPHSKTPNSSKIQMEVCIHLKKEKNIGDPWTIHWCGNLGRISVYKKLQCQRIFTRCSHFSDLYNKFLSPLTSRVWQGQAFCLQCLYTLQSTPLITETCNRLRRSVRIGVKLKQKTCINYTKRFLKHHGNYVNTRIRIDVNRDKSQ